MLGPPRRPGSRLPTGQLQLGLLDREQVPDRLKEGPYRSSVAATSSRSSSSSSTSAIRQWRSIFSACGDVRRRDVGVHERRPCTGRATMRCSPDRLGDGLVEHLHVQLKPEGRDVPRLLRPEEISRRRGSRGRAWRSGTRCRARVVGKRRQPRPRLGGQLGCVRVEEV